MLVELQSPAMLTKAIEIISDLVTEVRIKVNEFGMSITAMDPANVAMVNFKLPKSAFSKFELDSEVLGINLDDLKRILKRCGTGGSVIFEKKDNMLEIQINDRIARKFTLNLIEIESEDKEMPSLEFSSKVGISSIDLVDAIEDCGVVADACSFIVEEGKFIVAAKGINSARAEFSGDEATIQAENCKSRYSLEYLQKFMKGAKLCEKAIIKFAADHPLRLDFRTGELELSFILAPRVETED
ncbi:proliferating cell nuclear antigen (pcna) [archaeon]|jgi:proliferating cell nuclear antigen|nr:proliferating cell nuclear antigen (pcna) [archaeon]MBT4373259.1 proliferating cell nuclear antigen (pcna) [archaeon]MBT4531604.1 proliferating cell nuclear antigen (pcna) [archaeon]MBT7001218.1 proliferating cell nuclear antigen (pcna) [archaeon]MBT7282296.1 proliferating cell nuclear antigen (pcna) [archaeon]